MAPLQSSALERSNSVYMYVCMYVHVCIYLYVCIAGIPAMAWLKQIASIGHSSQLNNVVSCIFRDVRGNTPIHLASAAGYTHTVKLLLEIHSHLINAANK